MPISVLDNPEDFRKIDKNNMLQFCSDAAKQYLESAKRAEKIELDCPTPENIVVAGMGGSAIGGELLKDYLRKTAQVPIEISREYQLPAYSGKNTLVILASYSGGTEETLSSFVDALKRKCMVYCVSSGGELMKYATKLNVPHLQVREGMPPRAALPHMLLPMIKCMEKINMVPKNLAKEFLEAVELLRKVSAENAAEKRASENFAKTIALNLNGASPVIYGFGVFRGVALRFKQQFNENSKIPAKWEVFSELNHNETMGWENPKEFAENFAVLFLRDKAEPVEIRSRIETTQFLMKPKVPKVFEVWAQGKGDLAKMLSMTLMGDFVSVYLAYLRGVDPTPVNTVTVMKERIEQNGVKKKILHELDKMAKTA